MIVLLRYVLLCFLNSTTYTRVQNSAVTLTEIHDLKGNKLSWLSIGVAQKKSQVVPSWFSWVVEELRHTQWELCEKQVFIVIIQLQMVSSHKIIWTHQHLQNVVLADFPLQVKCPPTIVHLDTACCLDFINCTCICAKVLSWVEKEVYSCFVENSKFGTCLSLVFCNISCFVAPFKNTQLPWSPGSTNKNPKFV